METNKPIWPQFSGEIHLDKEPVMIEFKTNIMKGGELHPFRQAQSFHSSDMENGKYAINYCFNKLVEKVKENL